MPLPRVFLDFTVGDAPLGRVVFELFSDVVPKTAENFRALCTGEKRGADGTQLAYAGSPVHRVIEGFMIQGGDFTKRNGTGGESIYGGTFADERLSGDGTEVDCEGLLVMANRGPDTNGSQWFVTLAAAPHLTGKHVVFGRVVSGIEHIRAIGDLKTDGRDRPLSPVVVSRAGELELRRPAATRTPPPQSRSRSRSVTPSESDSEDERRRRRRARRERKEREREERRRERRERRRARDASDDDDGGGDREGKRERRRRRSRSASETLSELDARLEREENERLAAEKAAKLEEMRAEMESGRQAVRDSGGVVYKGAMRYRDPESRPANYNPRGHDTRPRRRRDDGGGRWERDGGGGGGGWRDDRGGGRGGGRGWDADRWERSAPRFERGGKDMDRWERGAMGDGAEAARERLADRITGRARDADVPDRLDYSADERDRERDRQVEVERERERDGGDGGRSARAGAWRAARRSPSPSPRRSISPPRRSLSPRRSPSPALSRDRRSMSAGSDMVMDD